MPTERLHLREVRSTTAFRLTAALGCSFAVSLLALIGLVYWMTAREFVQRTDGILHAELNRLMATAPADLPQQVRTEIAQSNGLSHIALVSGDGERIEGDLAIGSLPRPGAPFESTGPSGSLRIMSARTVSGETIVVARDISQIHYLRGRILVILLSSAVVILLALAGASVLVARGPLRRVRSLEQAAREIAAGRFDTRMPISGWGDELDRFAATVNVMVDEIGRVVQQVKGVTDAVAHDLRTPLGHVRSQLLRLSEIPQAASAAERAIADLDLVLARFAALLRIAEIEAGARRALFAPVDLASVASEAAELYAPLAEDRAIAFSSHLIDVPEVAGDRHLLFEAISNLLDNAIKFARSDVKLAVMVEGRSVAVSVQDDGPGIPAEERSAVLRRFHRGNNADGMPGSGLGLSIVAAIAHLHGADLRLDHAAPGLLVWLHFPSQVKII